MNCKATVEDLEVDLKEYYYNVFDKLKNTFEHSHYVLGYGDDLRIRDISQGRQARPETALPVTVEPLDQLWDLTVNWGLEVFIPVVGKNSSAILSCLDYEIYLDDTKRLYADKGSQHHYFHNYIGPVTGFIGDKLEQYNIPYMADLTPSGGHFLFWVNEGTEEWNELASIGCLEEDLKAAYNFHDHNDLKRNPKIKMGAGYVYSGLGRLWEYLSHEAVNNVTVGSKELPLTLSSPLNKCVNMDITQYADPAYMRIMRAPFSAHKKRNKVVPGANPLVDIVLWHYNGKEKVGEMNFENLIDCMWDHEKAVEHSKQFTGHIPAANKNLTKLVHEYKNSELYKFHQDFDCHPDLNKQEAFHRAINDQRLDDKTRSVLEHPNPRSKNPRALVRFINNLLENDWHPKHIGNLIADLYEQPQHDWNGDNWMKYPSRTRANFWARIYSGIALVKD
jgi:hypothetical protein